MAAYGMAVVRSAIFKVVIITLMVAALVIVSLYIAQGRYELIPWMLGFYFIPTLAVYLKIRKGHSEKAVFCYFFYLFSIQIGLRFVCEPTYVVDLLVSPGMVAVAALALNRRLVLGLSIYLALGMFLVSWIVKVYEPFEVVYRNSELGFGVWLYVFISLAFVTLTSFTFIREVELAAVEKDQVNERYRSLLATILHDLSNELAVAKMSIDLISTRAGEDSQIAKPASIAETAIAGLSETLAEVKKMHDLVKMKDNVESQMRSVPLSASLKKIEFIFATQLKEKNLKFTYNGDLLESIDIFTEPVIFSIQILSNLLSNAIKFSNPDGVVEVRVKKRDSNVLIEVVNLCSHYVDYKEVFQNSFTNQSVYGTAGESGLGLGLYIAYRQCQRLGIEIRGQCSKTSGDLYESTVSLQVPSR